MSRRAPVPAAARLQAPEGIGPDGYIGYLSGLDADVAPHFARLAG